ncbi:hypothetical protein BDY19DRAFT_735051 [Irpex rosettiformis]|uniref:Uncharacterized protein n=1 Tax=Irpex rosettiformis TaxID=378272 RepID=A0ACB8U9Y2_9APHY|nr:hypothetical protein BDY19DRAFT_735051 [Irpex rosettiformis]
MQHGSSKAAPHGIFVGSRCCFLPFILINAPTFSLFFYSQTTWKRQNMADNTSGLSDIVIFLKLHAMYQANPQLGAEKAHKQLLAENPEWAGKVSLKVRHSAFSLLQCR